jgi:hypothetical protein
MTAAIGATPRLTLRNMPTSPRAAVKTPTQPNRRDEPARRSGGEKIRQDFSGGAVEHFGIVEVRREVREDAHEGQRPARETQPSETGDGPLGYIAGSLMTSSSTSPPAYETLSSL